MQDRQHWLDIVRAIALIFVIFTHLIGAASMPILDLSEDFGEISDIQPLIDAAKVAPLARFMSFLSCGVNYGPAGVCLFFLVTGFLIPAIAKKYSRKEFAINRFFRIFPTYAFALSAIFIVNWVFLDRVRFPTTAVLWTLVIEVYFYLIYLVIGSGATPKNNFILQAFLVALILTQGGKVLIAAEFLLYINLGTWFYFLSKNPDKKVAAGFILSVTIFFMLSHKLKFNYSEDLLIYGFTVFGAIFLVRNMFCKLDFFTKFIADFSYPFYLLHWFGGGGNNDSFKKKWHGKYLYFVSCGICRFYFNIVVCRKVY